MVLQVLGGLLLMKKGRVLSNVFPESVRKLWNEWELRLMVVLSLFFQIVLMVTGNRRKYISRNWARIVLWLAYLSADSIATISLGVLSNNQKRGSLNSNDVMVATWAAFLLVHLGGPDTITAYSLEDNELWLRHLLGLVVQFGVAGYIFMKSWRANALNLLTIAMFVAGIIKYGERTWVLRSASRDHFRNSMIPRPDPGPNYAKFMDEYISRRAEGYKISIGTLTDVSSIVHLPTTAADGAIIKDAPILHDSHYFFKTFKLLFAELILSFQDVKNSKEFFRNKKWKEAFTIVEIELGFMYDHLYTKATFISSQLGVLLRCISFSSTVVAIAIFLVIDKSSFKGVDASITYLLLFGAIGLEFYGIVVVLSSDWTVIWLTDIGTMIWLRKFKKVLVCLAHWITSIFQLLHIIAQKKRWSNSMAQYNLISFCLKDNPTKCVRVQKLLCIFEFLETHRYKTLETVPDDLKDLIFERLLKKEAISSDVNQGRQFCNLSVEQILREMGCANWYEKLRWGVEVDLDQSILLWHIATDICYYDDLNRDRGLDDNFDCYASRLLSKYMLYLLVMCPSMLPNGIGELRFQDTCAEAMEFFEERKITMDRSKACLGLYEVNTDILPSEVKGDRSKTVLFDACRLAKALRSLEMKNKWERSGKKWELISYVWVELLSSAAAQCRWFDHAQQLRRGGELLTHVWLLMAHLGITQQFQISQGHARATLLVD